MKTIFLIANSDGALFNFRETLIRKLVLEGNKVITISGSSPEGSYKSKIEELGVDKHFELNFSGNKASLIPFLSLILSINKLIKKFNPEIVHCYTHKGCIAGSFATLLSRKNSIRLIFTITGLGRLFSSNSYINRFLRQLVTMLYRIICKRTHSVFFQNPDDASYFNSKCSLDRKKIIIVGGSGVDLNKFDAAGDYNLDLKSSIYSNSINPEDHKITVLMLGRGMVEKGFFEYYEAAKFISNIFPNKYLFIHAGSIDDDVLAKLDGSSIELFASSHSVKFLGFRRDSAALLFNSDIVVHPSYYREGVPRSLIEALAMDKTIITCDTVGNREVLVDAWNGFFCEPKNHQSLISSIFKADDSFRFKSVGRSLSLAKAKFDVEMIDSIVIQAYFN